jgi:hypothetical protein
MGMRVASKAQKKNEPGPDDRRVVAESFAIRKARAREILRRLDRAYPGAGIALRFGNPLELLVATILSAQCTDERVNAVTETLFRRYRSARDYADSVPTALERDIHPTGFFRAKARALIGMGRAVVERHAGHVPGTLEELTSLPGVGRPLPSIPTSSACPSVSAWRKPMTRTWCMISSARSSLAHGGRRPPICSSPTAGARAGLANPTAPAVPSRRCAPGQGRLKQRPRSS